MEESRTSGCPHIWPGPAPQRLQRQEHGSGLRMPACLQQAATRLLRPSVLPEARLLFPCRHFVAQDSDTRAAGLGRRGQGPSAEWTGHESGELQRAPARVWMAQQDPHHRYNVKRVARGKEVDFSASSEVACACARGDPYTLATVAPTLCGTAVAAPRHHWGQWKGLGSSHRLGLHSPTSAREGPRRRRVRGPEWLEILLK